MSHSSAPYIVLLGGVVLICAVIIAYRLQKLTAQRIDAGRRASAALEEMYRATKALRARHGLADVTQPDGIASNEGDIAENRRAERSRPFARRQMPQMADHRAVIDGLRQVLQHDQKQHADTERQRRRQHVPAAGHGARSLKQRGGAANKRTGKVRHG